MELPSYLSNKVLILASIMMLIVAFVIGPLGNERCNLPSNKEKIITPKTNTTDKIIGIHLGSTNSYVSMYQQGKVTMIPNDYGNIATPSIVSFTTNRILIGDEAYNVMKFNTNNSIFDVKRFIGKSFNDRSAVKDITSSPLKIINKYNKPYFEITYQDNVNEFSVEQITTMLLTKIKQTTESYFGHKIKKVIITVPDYFHGGQRTSIKNAADMAGLEAVRIISESVAAYLGKHIDIKRHCPQDKELFIIVYHLGGITFNVSLLICEDSVFEIYLNEFDTHLGGQNFDENILNLMIKKFKKRTNLDIRSNNKGLNKLFKECKKAKHRLSSTKQVEIEIENIMNGYDFNEVITRAEFEYVKGFMLFKKT